MPFPAADGGDGAEDDGRDGAEAERQGLGRAGDAEQAQPAAWAQQTASEDFSDIPRAAGIPYTYWGIGGTDPQAYRAAEKAGRAAEDIPGNHSPHFLPVPQPTLRAGTEALTVAALAWLAPR